MEDLGFFDHIYEKLPDDFPAVFEIARVLEDESHPLTGKLAPILKLHAPAQRRESGAEAVDLQVYIDEAQEYEGGFIRHPRHLPRIYNHQWLLPEEIFYQRLARKELWVPYAREPKYYPVDPEAEDYSPDNRKQKLYVLLDTSSSMALKNRINLAKAVVYYFLKHNMRELGYINLRTFDTKVGALHVARDRLGFHSLISFVMRLHTLGNGTAMARAIEQAIEDIRGLPELSGTEILIISDGACALNEQDIRERLGDTISISTIKIGRSQLYPSKSYIRDKIFEEDNEQHRLITDLQRKEKDLQRLIDSAQSPQLKKSYTESLRHTQRELQRLVDAITEEIVVGYGHELERLSDLYLTVDDVDLTSVIGTTEYAVGELEALFDQLAHEIEALVTLDSLRKLALLNDHLMFLNRNVTDSVMKARLEQLQKRILEKLSSTIESQFQATQSGMLPFLSPEDRHDLEYLLFYAPHLNLSFWRLLVWKLVHQLRGILPGK